jgi:hypothetical protein
MLEDTRDQTYPFRLVIMLYQVGLLDCRVELDRRADLKSIGKDRDKEDTMDFRTEA